MLRHIVLWKLTEEAKAKGTKAIIEEVQPLFDGLIGKIDGLLFAKVSENLVESHFDMMLYTEFTDLAAMKAYQPNPLHQAVSKAVTVHVAERTSFDAKA